MHSGWRRRASPAPSLFKARSGTSSPTLSSARPAWMTSTTVRNCCLTPTRWKGLRKTFMRRPVSSERSCAPSSSRKARPGVFRATRGAVPKLRAVERGCASVFSGIGDERNACTNRAGAWTRLCDPLQREIGKKAMSRIFPQWSVFRLQRIALAIGLFLLPVAASAQQHEGAFSRFAGDWSGEGTVKTSAGSERIRCKVHYDVASDGTSLEQILHCASDSYKLEVRSKVAATGTRFAGKWAEVTRDTI